MISSLLHLVGLRPRVYYTLTNFFWGGGGAKAPLAPPSIRQCPQISFFSYNRGALLRSVSLLTICPPPLQISFFACYRGGHLRSVSSQNIWGPLQISFSAYYMGIPLIFYALNYPCGRPHIFEFPGGEVGGKCPPPCRRP